MSMEPSQQTKRYMDSIDQDEIQNVNPASAQSIPQEVGNRSAVPVENVSVDVPSIPTPVMIKVKENSASQDSTNSSLSKMSLPSPSKWPGPYLRLQPFSMARLPHHFSFQHLEPTDIQDTQYKRPSIRLFVLSIISEALYLAKHQVPKWVRKASKTYEDVDSKVDLFEDEVFKNDITTSNGDLAKNDVRDWKQYTEPTEYWFARHSIHEDRAIPRTASWEEFIGGLRDNHSENEMAYTKEIQDARLILDYTQELEDSGLMAQIDGLTLRSEFFCCEGTSAHI